MKQLHQITIFDLHRILTAYKPEPNVHSLIVYVAIEVNLCVFNLI